MYEYPSSLVSSIPALLRKLMQQKVCGAYTDFRSNTAYSMILSADASTTVSLTRSLCHTVQGLNRHEKGGKKDNKAYTKGNVGVALEFLHEVEQTNLPHQCGKETNSEANHGVVRNEQTEYNKGSRCSEAGKENHACRRRRRHLGMNSHCKHKRTLDYATSNSKHTSEESS
mmetsp:Transcript_33054/g.66669  ORF Transcript_33054/g.66669 Transcript_33054/m.66669 type:complete len:171 (-) Transcript_33054:379-891(-)